MSTDSPQPRRALVVVALSVLFALSFALAACGDDDSDTSGDTSSAAESNEYSEALAQGYKADADFPLSDDESDCVAREFVAAVGGPATFEAAEVAPEDLVGVDNPLRQVNPSDEQARAAGGAFSTCGIRIVDMLFEPGSISDEVRTCIEDALTDQVLGEAFVADPDASGAVIGEALEPCNRLS